MGRHTWGQCIPNTPSFHLLSLPIRSKTNNCAWWHMESCFYIPWAHFLLQPRCKVQVLFLVIVSNLQASVYSYSSLANQTLTHSLSPRREVCTVIPTWCEGLACETKYIYSTLCVNLHGRSIVPAHTLYCIKYQLIGSRPGAVNGLVNGRERILAQNRAGRAGPFFRWHNRYVLSQQVCTIEHSQSTPPASGL